MQKNLWSDLPDLTDKPFYGEICDWCHENKKSEWLVDPFIFEFWEIEDIAKFFCDDCYEKRLDEIDSA